MNAVARLIQRNNMACLLQIRLECDDARIVGEEGYDDLRMGYCACDGTKMQGPAWNQLTVL